MRLRHKYKAKPSYLDGMHFPSKLERACYEKLVELQESKKILFFLRQIPFDIGAGKKHRVDFCVFTDEEVILIESKGRDLSEGVFRRKLCEEKYPVEIHVVKKASEIEGILKEND